MKLKELLPPASGLRVHGADSVDITGLSYDSRKIVNGNLFFALARDGAQSRRNIGEALSRGARAVVAAGWEADARPANFTVIECDQPRLLMAWIASRFYNAPSRRLDVVGVTGTSGKTTTTYLLASIFAAAGLTSGIIGTIGAFIGEEQIYAGLTTPESLDFESILAEMERRDVRKVAAEVSSIGIVEQRVGAIDFRACVFTNLGRDHLDYHQTLERYFAAKLRLFTEFLAHSTHPDPVAIVRGDDPYGQRVLAATKCRRLSFGLSTSLDVHPVRFEACASGIQATIAACGRILDIESPLLGEINLLNIIAAAAVALAVGIDGGAVVEGLRRCPGAPGRLERTPGAPGVNVMVDYAHKPEALEGMLKSLRALRPRRLICVFGCGGDRDRGKRPIMGEIAGRMADLSILTTDNPRGEDPLKIIGEVEAGFHRLGLSRFDARCPGAGSGYLVEPDRRTAIALALKIAAPGDFVVVAGKGHENYQLVGEHKFRFDDRAVIREIVAGT